MQCAMHLVFVLLGVALIAVPASAQTFPLTGVSTTSRYELLDQVELTALSATAAFDASKGYLRYSMLSVPSGAGIVTTVTDVASLKRYTFSGTWSSTCAVAAPPAAGSADIKYAVAALVASGAAASQRGVSSALVYANTSSLRNIASKRWIATAATLTVNTTSCTVNLQWDFTNQWILNPTQSTSAQQLIGFSVNGSCAGSPIMLSGNVVWVSQATPNALLFQPLGTCNATMPSAAAPSTVVTTPAPTTASTNAFPLPTLPNVFSALIQATFAERATTFSVYESNSGSYARATFLWPTTAKTVVVDGTSALAYLQTSTSTGLSSAWADPMAADGTFATRQFFSTADTCSKTVFTYSLLNSVSDLLAKSASLNPRYMGQILVRGISTQYWRVVSGTQTYTWYFASTSWQFPSNATSSYRQLVRVTASGSGLSPFFVAHPYLQRWLPQPQSTIPFCANVMDIAPDECTDSQRNFVHIYDFMSFVPRVDASEVAVPSSCTSDTGSVVTSTTDCPATMSGGSIFMLFFFSALFGGLLGAGAMYCRLKRKFKSADAAHEDDD